MYDVTGVRGAQVKGNTNSFLATFNLYILNHFDQYYRPGSVGEAVSKAIESAASNFRWTHCSKVNWSQKLLKIHVWHTL